MFMSSHVLKILLVENHDDTLTYLAEYLRECGHTVRSATSMNAALKSLADESVDILISDIGLPDGDGWQLLRRIHELKLTAPFSIAMSGYSTKADIEKSRVAGYRHHLVKPFLPDELDVLIQEAATSFQKV